jgi:hypothetical protein
LISCHLFTLVGPSPLLESEAHGQDCQYWLGLMPLFMLLISSSITFD